MSTCLAGRGRRPAGGERPSRELGPAFFRIWAPGRAHRPQGRERCSSVATLRLAPAASGSTRGSSRVAAEGSLSPSISLTPPPPLPFPLSTGSSRVAMRARRSPALRAAAHVGGRPPGQVMPTRGLPGRGRCGSGFLAEARRGAEPG